MTDPETIARINQREALAANYHAACKRHHGQGKAFAALQAATHDQLFAEVYAVQETPFQRFVKAVSGATQGVVKTFRGGRNA